MCATAHTVKTCHYQVVTFTISVFTVQVRQKRVGWKKRRKTLNNLIVAAGEKAKGKPKEVELAL